MSIVIDASVFVAALREEERHYSSSREFLRRIQAASDAVVCPTLVLPECAAAIIRSTGDATLARVALRLIQSFPRIQLVPVELAMADWAAQLAIEHHFRGADSVYIATAEVFQATLVTWDGEMLARAPSEILVCSPDEWLKRHPLPQPD